MKILCTGACGFIGTNIVKYYASRGHTVFGVDNLSRKGSKINLKYLKDNYPKNFFFLFKDISERRDFVGLPDVDAIFHMAAQVGVQKSIKDPWFDFASNIKGTLNVLEYARHQEKKPIVIYASTNKVYGNIQVNKPVSETTPLDFHTPYGCSKGAADQYVLDYNRIYGVPTVVFRQSCIYGPHQCGSEEQGWVAWFLIADYTNQQLTVFGDGNQVRDVLYIDDLIRLYDMAIRGIHVVEGEAYNIGGGPGNTLSLNELIKLADIRVPVKYTDWRPSDQKYYVSDISLIKCDVGWQPLVGKQEGIKKLQKFIRRNPKI